MKKILLLTAGMLLIAASCTKNEVVEVNQDGNEIQYSVVANKATKAAQIYDNNNFSQFTVYAETADGEDLYINGDVVSKKGNVWENENVRFWPEAALNFYALNNAPESFVFAAGTVPSFKFTVADKVDDQKDLVYAVSMNQSRSTDVTGPGDEETPVVEGASVELNFRHALSQIVFKAKNTNPNLYVEVSGVQVVKVTKEGTYTLPQKTTSLIPVKEGENAGGTTDPVNDGSRGAWKEFGDKNVAYAIDFGTVKLKGQKTAEAVALGGEVAHSMMLVPQQTDAWVPETAPAPANQTGSYFMVNCVIWNVADPEIGKTDKDLVIWGEKGDGDGKYVAEPAWVAIPVAFDWKEGFKYVYTFIFDKGAGYDPNPGEDPDPKPAIIPISFEVNVDDFNVVESDIDLDVTPEEDGE